MYTKCIQREVTISMAAKKTRKRKTSSAKKRTRTRQKDFAPFYKEIAVLVVFALFIFLFLSNFGICGYIGNSISTFFFGAFGTTHYIIPAVSFILAILLISNDYSSLAVKKTCFAILLLCMVSTIFQMIYNIEVRDAYSAFVFSGRTHRGGGYLGALICSILYKELGGAGSVLVVLLISVISLILVTERSLLSFLKKAVDFFTVEGYEEDIEERLAKKKRKAKEVSKEDKETAPRKKRSMHIPDLRSGRPKPSQASPMPPMEPEEKTKQTPIQKDFDDLIVKTVELFQNCGDVLENYQERFRYIMVDEYQDTNTVQFRLVSLLAGKYRNLCVVGDDDQSIYKFRGANIRNILDFEKEFSDAKVIKLEQNYRSVGNVLEVANSVIRNNKGRKEKTLWTDNEKGEKIRLRQFDTAYDEAQFIAEDIKDETAQGANYSDHAVLYRTNAQSRLLEEKFVAMNIPYKIVGGINFYSRREIKDVLSYLKTIDNGKDDLAVRRIINVPKRGIGLTTINRIQESAAARGIGFYDALSAPDLIPGIGRSASKLDSFAALIEYFKGRSEESGVTDLLTEVIEKTGYTESLEADDPEELEARVQNIDELVSKAAVYEESCSDRGERPTLSGFLEEVALVADIDSVAEDRDYVILMTLHSAKGLEFPHVYLAGMEDGLFPSYMSISGDDPEELEEERRLCYVGVTRAEEKLTLTCARMRLVRGERQYNSMSRFIKEMPSALIDTGKREGGFSQNVSLGEKRTYSSEVSGYKRSAYAQKPAFAAIQKGSGLMAKKSEGLSYGVGDRVRHVKFGDGTVTEIKEGGRDYEVTVQFDTAGVRKMFALFAKLIKI